MIGNNLLTHQLGDQHALLGMIEAIFIHPARIVLIEETAPSGIIQITGRRLSKDHIVVATAAASVTEVFPLLGRALP